MNYPRFLMATSALFLAALGVPCVFAPEVVLARFVANASTAAELVVQLAGALYFGFAALNWMSRGSLMGGIYGRPVAIGNLLHFVSGAFALAKSAPTLGEPALAWAIAIGYVLFALGFALVVFRNPLVAKETP
jgi:hypothetical protein